MPTRARTLRLSADQADALDMIAVVYDLSTNEEIRQAIDAHIEERLDGEAADIDLGRGTSRVLWSPAGDRIAYASDRGLVVADPDGSNALGVSPNAGYALATWSPDGRYLLHMRDIDGRHWDLLSTAATTPIATVTVVHAIPTTSARLWPGRDDVSWQPLHP